ncbi:MAG: hypothetical protein HZC17_09750 [Candidatus Omnitrophica bacterium]|nr:hypothetical protein [Candidatus Omnitrophota bacterium]
MENPVIKIKRRYFEAFGDIEKENNFLRKITLGLVCLVFVSSVLLFFSGKRMPVVIRVDELGSHAIKDLALNNEPDAHEIVGFAKRFTVRFTGYNSYTILKDLTESFNQMTSRFQKQAQRGIIESGLIQKVIDARIDTEIEFKEEHLERDSKENSVVSLLGVRKIRGYGDEGVTGNTLFRADLVLRKVSRTRETPEGLLVEEYKETTLNELKERKQS